MRLLHLSCLSMSLMHLPGLAKTSSKSAGTGWSRDNFTKVPTWTSDHLRNETPAWRHDTTLVPKMAMIAKPSAVIFFSFVFPERSQDSHWTQIVIDILSNRSRLVQPEPTSKELDASKGIRAFCSCKDLARLIVHLSVVSLAKKTAAAPEFIINFLRGGSNIQTCWCPRCFSNVFPCFLSSLIKSHAMDCWDINSSTLADRNLFAKLPDNRPANVSSPPQCWSWRVWSIENSDSDCTLLHFQVSHVYMSHHVTPFDPHSVYISVKAKALESPCKNSNHTDQKLAGKKPQTRPVAVQLCRLLVLAKGHHGYMPWDAFPKKASIQTRLHVLHPSSSKCAACPHKHLCKKSRKAPRTGVLKWPRRWSERSSIYINGHHWNLGRKWPKHSKKQVKLNISYLAMKLLQLPKNAQV